MRPTAQTRHGNPGGNCLQAAIATLLEVPLDDIPDFANGPETDDSIGWFLELADWLKTLGLRALPTDIETILALRNWTGIMIGYTEGGSPHATVWADGSHYWDPGSLSHDTDPLRHPEYGIGIVRPLRELDILTRYDETTRVDLTE